MLFVFLFGAFSASQVLVWHYFNKICPQSIAAVGIAVTNMIITLVIAMIRIVVLTIVMINATALAIMDVIVTVMSKIALMDVTITMPIIMAVLVSNHQLIPKFLQDTVLMPPEKFLLKEDRQLTL